MAQKAIQRNGCYEHTKLVLKAMLHDERTSFRTRAADKILELRNDSLDRREAEVEAKRNQWLSPKDVNCVPIFDMTCCHVL